MAMTLEQVRDILRNAGRFDIYGTNEQACDLADAIDAHLSAQAKGGDLSHPDVHVSDVERWLSATRAVIEEDAVRLSQGAQGEIFYAFRRKGLDDYSTCTKERFDELSNKPNLFETRIFYTHPAERAAVPEGWTERHDKVERFALRRFADNARERAEAASQDKDSRYFNVRDVEKFLEDAKTADECLAMLAAATQPPGV